MNGKKGVIVKLCSYLIWFACQGWPVSMLSHWYRRYEGMICLIVATGPGFKYLKFGVVTSSRHSIPDPILGMRHFQWLLQLIECTSNTLDRSSSSPYELRSIHDLNPSYPFWIIGVTRDRPRYCWIKAGTTLTVCRRPRKLERYRLLCRLPGGELAKRKRATVALDRKPVCISWVLWYSSYFNRENNNKRSQDFFFRLQGLLQTVSVQIWSERERLQTWRSFRHSSLSGSKNKISGRISNLFHELKHEDMIADAFVKFLKTCKLDLTTSSVFHAL